MNFFRAAWAALTLVLISYVGCTHYAQAATTEQVTALMGAFGTTKMRVLNTRKIVFWEAQANATARCWKFFVPASVATPPVGQGFYAHQWMMQTTSAVVTEEQCYAQP